ncbi:MAG: hypothetical protein ACI8RZ_002839 [Myxococcota bacterium]|jgi:hypothetical protein
MIRALFLTLMLTGCGDKDDSGAALSDACGLAEDYSACPACDDGEVTCEYDTYSETTNSCGDCQARAALYWSLCEGGIGDDAATIEAGVTCTDPVALE